MPEPLLAARRVSKRFGGVVASDNVSFEVAPAEIHALIGPNGSGKTTLLRQLFGELRPDSGAVELCGADVTRRPVAERVRAGLGRSYQSGSFFGGFTVRENVAFGVRAAAGVATRFTARASAYRELDVEAGEVLRAVGLLERSDALAESLSHGESRQLELALALATRPRVVLLDEPLAGLGAGETRAMVARIAALRARCAVVLVEHDMDAVFALAQRVTVMVEGRVAASGPSAEIRADPAVRAAYLGERGR